MDSALQVFLSLPLNNLPYSDVLDFLIENAPVAAAVGGVAASTALVANPSLPMTGSNGVPPGIFMYLFLLLTYHNQKYSGL